MRLVLATNVLVSGLAYPGSLPGKLVGAWRAGELELATSRFILDELARVLPALRPPRLTALEVSQLVELVEFKAQVVVTPAAVPEPALRDPADLPVLGTYLAAQADYLVTGYKDLLALAREQPGQYNIVSPREFWDTHG